MRIGISSTGQGLDSKLSPLFGRCAFFVVVDIENNEITNNKTIENKAVMQAGGAGIMAAQTIGNENVNVVISNSIGPRAFDVLQQLGIEMYKAQGSTVKEAVDLFIQGKLSKINAAGIMGIGKGQGLGRRRGFNQ
ncbi:MAG: NifB/NifX family molybdenum-iron cluster-binding protein [Candidatus Omnitrophica bacterium]|nr:NifB/NifX family molybdenum-iron cluster-binding protein [Candidatus Omnitrophota bacterium]